MLVDLLQRQGAGGADSPEWGSHGGVRSLGGWESQGPLVDKTPLLV